MFERYTERARRVLFFARYEASQLGGLSIETEHILLGLIRESKGLAGQVFTRARISLEDIRKEIERRAVFRERLSTSVEMPFSAEVKRVLHFAAEEADRLLHDYIGSEHLLLGLLREQGSVAGRILIDRGLRLEAVRRETVTGPLGIAPSYDLHVSRMNPDAPQGQFTNSGPDYFFAQGFTVRAILAWLLNADERRIEMPPDLDRDERYEFKLRLPAVESWQAMESRVLDGIEHHFDVCITQERRLLDVYVLTAPLRETLALHRATEQDGGIGAASIEYSIVGDDQRELGRPSAHQESPYTIGPLSMSGSTLADLAGSLEELLGRPVVDETGLDGRYDIEVRGNHDGIETFLAALQDQLGLAVTRARREIGMIVVQRG